MDEFDTPSPDARIWYVLHVKPRTEKKVMLYLERYRCFRYLPLVVKVTILGCIIMTIAIKLGWN